MSDDELENALTHFETRRARREAFELLTLVNPSAFTAVQIAAEDLKASKQIICEAAKRDHKTFFIQLGKILEGRMKPNAFSKLDEDTAFILCLNPNIKSTEAVKALENLGHPPMSPWAFKQKRYNWRRAAAKTRRIWEEHYGRKDYMHVSFLDGIE